MELATGGERTIDGIADGSEIVLGHPKTREAMRAGLAMYFVTLDDPALMEIAERIVAELGDRALLQHPARRRPRDRDQPADLDDRLPGGSEPPLPRRQARARRDLGRRAARARARASGRAERRCATSTRSSGTLTWQPRGLDVAEPVPSPHPPRGQDSACRHAPCVPWPRAALRSGDGVVRTAPFASSTARSTPPACRGTNVQALRRKGVDARLVVFERYKLHPEADWSLDRRGGFAPRQLDAVAQRFARLAAADRRLPLLLRADARPEVAPVPDPARARARSPSSTTSAPTSAARRPPSSRFGKRAGAEIVGSYDAIRWVPEAEVDPAGHRPHARSRRSRRPTARAR